MMKISRQKIDKVLHRKIEVVDFVKFSTTFVAIFILVTLYRKGVIAPIFVNGEPVSFTEILKVLREEGSSNLLDRLLAEKIVEIEAKRRNIEVKKEEIDAEIFKIEKQAIEDGITLNQLLKQRGQNLENLEKNIKLQITVYKLIAEDVEVSENEIDQFIFENRDLYKDKEREQIRSDVKNLLLIRKVEDQYQSWIKDAKANTEINYVVRF